MVENILGIWCGEIMGIVETMYNPDIWNYPPAVLYSTQKINYYMFTDHFWLLNSCRSIFPVADCNLCSMIVGQINKIIKYKIAIR